MVKTGYQTGARRYSCNNANLRLFFSYEVIEIAGPASYNLLYGVTFAIYSPSFPCAIQIEAAYVLTPHAV